MSAWDRALLRVNRALRNTFPYPAILTPVDTEIPEEHVCVYDFEWVEIVISGDVVQSGMMHTAWINLADITRAPRTVDGYSVNGTEYEIIDVRQDGTGGVKLVLHVVE